MNLEPISVVQAGSIRVFSPMPAGVRLPRPAKLRALAVVRMDPATRLPTSPPWFRAFSEKDGKDAYTITTNDADGLVVVDRISSDGHGELILPLGHGIQPSLLFPGPIDCRTAHERIEVEIRSVTDEPISLVVLGSLFITDDLPKAPSRTPTVLSGPFEVLVPFQTITP